MRTFDEGKRVGEVKKAFQDLKNIHVNSRTKFIVCLSLCLALVTSQAFAQEAEPQKDLKHLSLEELMNLEVTSVSRRPEKLFETPSAIQVVTGEDIGKFGATNIPEALYLAGNLQVAQSGSHSYGISARGFNTQLANKLLVLMDGRTVYTPLYSGVFWDRQDYLLKDLNQIEVISGPGGTLWGANAVNGVINITSKRAQDTQGLFAEAAGGNELRGMGAARYGGKLAPNVYFRVYGKYANRDAAVYQANNASSYDPWRMAQGGFRIDAERGTQTHFTLQGDIYDNNGDINTVGTSKTKGGNILGRWNHTFSDSSDMRLQVYFDRTYWLDPTPAFLTIAPRGILKDGLSTIDVDFQHRIRLTRTNNFVWGLGYRLTQDRVSNSPYLQFTPTVFDQSLFSLFAQDELKVVRDLWLTIGSKLEHNAYVGFILEPNARVRYKINEKNNIWGSISRAVRTPSRIDRNFAEGAPPAFVLLQGSSNFIAETVIATEFGYRSQIGSRATTSASFYWNQYDHIRSTVTTPATVFPLYFENGIKADTYGFELSLTYQVADWWKLFSSYNRLREIVRTKPGASDFSNGHNETADPKWQFSVRSSFDLPYRLSISPAFRWIDGLQINNGPVVATVSSYMEMDGSIGWQATDHINLSIAGRNLLHKNHVEYGFPDTSPTPNRQAIQRSVYVKVMFSF